MKEIKVPPLGESVTTATIGTILKAHGTQVQENEEVIELETEKVNQVLYAPSSGEISWNVQSGAKVAIGDVIGTVDESKKGRAAAPAEPVAPAKKEEPSPARMKQQEFLEELKATPQPKPMVEKAIASGARREKMSKVRKTIAAKLVESLRTSAMLTTFNEVDMSAVMEMRAKHKESFAEKYQVKLGLMSFFVKATVDALKTYPNLNATIERDEIVHPENFNIGIAVGGAKSGLMVPVLRQAEFLSFAEIEMQIREFSEKAKAGRLSVSDLSGGTFTISNGGVYGSLLSTPILNPPQSGILGMHKIEKRAVVIDDKIVIRPMMYLALSYDHRLVDGKEAISFLVHVKTILEDPACLMLQ